MSQCYVAKLDAFRNDAHGGMLQLLLIAQQCMCDAQAVAEAGRVATWGHCDSPEFGTSPASSRLVDACSSASSASLRLTSTSDATCLRGDASLAGFFLGLVAFLPVGGVWLAGFFGLPLPVTYNVLHHAHMWLLRGVSHLCV